MLFLLLPLLASAGDRTMCEKKFFTVSPNWGVRMPARPDCKREKAETGDAYKASKCITAAATLVIPDPFDAKRVQLHVTEPVKMFDLNPDAPKKGKSLTLHDGWITDETTVRLLGGDGQPIEVPITSNAQAKGDAQLSPLRWEIPIELTEEQLRHLRKVGFSGWSYEVKGQRFTHFVKKIMFFDTGVDCVLDGVEPGAKR